MKIPTKEQAINLLKEGSKLNPGRWVTHAEFAGLAAKLIAKNIPSLDSEVCYVLGILHDIGRMFGVKQMSHIIDGYNFMMKKNFGWVARISLTHSFPLKDTSIVFGKWDCSESDYNFVKNFIDKTEYDDYDRIIQLADYLSLPEGFTILEKRMIDIAMRYGTNENSVLKWKALFEIKEYFDQKAGQSIYNFLPDIEKITFS
ncbi:MAG: phosphohydrolase [Spirochaetes bacterium GWD1_27_9]|nr:MAG: phosphohydrolase [Spirochaetes bacterium GWB1_27_13]OHD22232.1 MAG: phosphohydrolase [Spirochaetes bacterium GWC1_27_15]OHD44790.1 MAG: phosphohydrolase [Spirochaetes bacterium GWD1_27_9]